MTAPRTWQELLIERYPDFFRQQIDDVTIPSGYPTVGDGWRDLVERTVLRIEAAVHGAAPGSFSIVQIKEKFASLRFYWRSPGGLSDEMVRDVVEAVALGEARSACTCETCGKAGRLYRQGGRYETACEDHARGTLLGPRPGEENEHVEKRRVAGKLKVVRRRRYDRDTDSFIDLPVGNADEED
jgi:hypothetical protein